MKKIFLSALIMGSAAVAANAQAGSILTYGNIGYQSTKYADGSKQHSFNVTPGLGYQIDGHFTVGLYGNFSTVRSNSGLPNAATSFTNDYGVGVFVRHAMPVTKIFTLYSQLQGGFIGETIGASGGASSANSSGFDIQLFPAIGVNIIDGFGLNFSFGGLEYQSINSIKSFNFTWGNQLNIGVSRNLFCGHHKHHHRGMMMNQGSKVDKNDAKEDDSDN